MGRNFLITCEHAVKDVPEPYKRLFKGQEAVLDTHRAFDPGSWKLAGRVAMVLGAPLLLSSVSRLLVDLNRDEANPECFSEFTRDLSDEDKLVLLEKYHRRFRRDAEDMIEIARQRRHSVVHLSIHSFAPEFNGQRRDAEVGILFDSGRESEVAICRHWLDDLGANAPSLRVKENYPYLGTDDGLTTWLRKRFPSEVYAGIELELNHGPFFQDKERWDDICDAVVASLQRIFPR